MASNKKNRQKRATPKKQKATKATGAVKNKGGRPSYVATARAREIVRLLASHAIPYTEIARAIDPPCNVTTLQKVFEVELEGSRAKYRALVARALRVQLLGRAAIYDKKGRVSVSEIKPNAATAIFQAKVVLGNREYPRTETRDGRSLITSDMIVGLSEAEKDQLEGLLQKMERTALEAASQQIDDEEVQRYASLALNPAEQKLN